MLVPPNAFIETKQSMFKFILLHQDDKKILPRVCFANFVLNTLNYLTNNSSKNSNQTQHKVFRKNAAP